MPFWWSAIVGMRKYAKEWVDKYPNVAKSNEAPRHQKNRKYRNARRMLLSTLRDDEPYIMQDSHQGNLLFENFEGLVQRDMRENSMNVAAVLGETRLHNR